MYKISLCIDSSAVSRPVNREKLSPAKRKMIFTEYLLLLSWYFTSKETIRLIRDGRMEVGEEGDYFVPIATLSPPE